MWEEGREEGEDQEQRKQQGKKKQDEHKTKTTLNVLVTSVPSTEKKGCEQHGPTLHTFWSCQCLSLSSPKEVFVYRTLLSKYCPCSVSISSPMRVKVFVCFVDGSRISLSISQSGCHARG